VKRLATNWCGSYLEFRYHSDEIFVLHSLPNKNEIDGGCSSYGGGERCIQGLGAKIWGERGHWGEPSIDGRIIFGRE
jgi:hypothetical protein